MRSLHQQRVDQFMAKAGQDTPDYPCIPDEPTRILRATLILEESLETIRGLGVDVMIEPMMSQRSPVALHDTMYTLQCNKHRVPDLVEIADGCADISVVTTGTLSACGLADTPFIEAVDEANLQKFGPGGYRRDDGKWIKPADWTPPDIAGIIESQLATQENTDEN